MSHRPAMIASLIRTVVAGVAREIPIEECGIVSINEVIVSPELSLARVYLTALKNPKEAVKFLQERTGMMRKELASQLQAHRIPELKFIIDDRPEQQSRIGKLLEG